MKRWMKKQTALLLALLTCLNMFVLPASAEETAVETSTASVVEESVPETVSLQVTDGDLQQGDFSGEGEEITGETTDALDGDADFLGGTEQEGNTQVELDGNDADLNFEEDPTADLDPGTELENFQNSDVTFEEGSDLVLNDDETVDEEANETLGLFGAEVSSARGEMVLSTGQSTTVTIYYKGVPKGGSLRVGAWKNVFTQSDAVGLSWGGASGGKATLNISAKKTGTCYVEVFICNSFGIPYDVAQIKVNVCNAKLSCSAGTNIQVTQGGSKTLYFTASGYSGESVLTYTTTNANAYSCTLNNGTMTIRGKAQGTGRINVFYKAKKTGDVLKTMTVYVTTTAVSKPKLTVSASSLSLTPGQSQSITVSYSGYSGGVRLSYGANTSAVLCSWPDSWYNQSRTLTIKGLKNGSGTVTVNLLSSTTGEVLATAKITVTVAPVPTIKASASSLTLEAGKTGSVTYTLGNVTNQHTISSTNTNSKVCATALSQKNGKFVLTVTAKNAGSATVTVRIKDGRGIEKARSILTVTVKAAKPTLKQSASSMTMKANQTGSVIFTYSNCSGAVSLKAGKSSSCCNIAWGNWNGSSIPLTIKALEPGTCTVTVQLVQNSNVVATKLVLVTVQPADSNKRLDISSISYGFSNYSKKISLTNYQRIFGKNQYAASLQKSHETSAHGVCFGMAATSALMYENVVPTTEFGASKTSKLSSGSKTKKSNAYGIMLSDFIEMMYTTQFARALTADMIKNIDNAADTIMSEIDKGNPVCLAMYGQKGHEITAIGYSLTGNTLTVDIYDNNYPMSIRTLTMKRPSASGNFNSWSYKNASGYTYKNSTHTLAASDIASIKSIWNNRGSYSAVTNPNLNGLNMVCTNENDFVLSTYDLDAMTSTTVVEFADGQLVSAAEGVYIVPVVRDGETENVGHCFFVPEDYYYVEDGTPEDGISISITADTLSTSLETTFSSTEEGAMGFCAVDNEYETLATASVAIADGAAYQISIGVTDENGESSTITKEGIGCGEAVNLGLSGDTLSLGAAEDSQSAVVTQLPAIASYAVSAYAGEGGTITPAGLTEYAEGENALYYISAGEGYSISSVYVDGVDVGPVSSWYFEDITADHSIDVIFKQDLNALSLTLEQSVFAYTGEAVEPVVTLSDESDNVLAENEDYIVSYDNNVEEGKATIVVMATADSAYYGVLEAEFFIEMETTPLIASASAEGTTIDVTMKESAYAEPGILVAAVYDKNGKMIFVDQRPLQTYGETLTFTLENALEQTNKIKLFTLTGETYLPRKIGYEVP